jgi:hypothetical protein
LIKADLKAVMVRVAKGVAGACLVLKLNFSSVITKNLGPKFNPNAKTKITRIGVVKPQTGRAVGAAHALELNFSYKLQFVAADNS